MKNKKLFTLFVFALLLTVLLTACGGQPTWKIASEGDSCTPATVIERNWSDSDHRNFYLLLKAEDGEIGEAIVNAYQYDSLSIGDETCIVR